MCVCDTLAYTDAKLVHEAICIFFEWETDVASLHPPYFCSSIRPSDYRVFLAVFGNQMRNIRQLGNKNKTDSKVDGVRLFCFQ